MIVQMICGGGGGEGCVCVVWNSKVRMPLFLLLWHLIWFLFNNYCMFEKVALVNAWKRIFLNKLIWIFEINLIFFWFLSLSLLREISLSLKRDFSFFEWDQERNTFAFIFFNFFSFSIPLFFSISLTFYVYLFGDKISHVKNRFKVLFIYLIVY